MKVAIQCVPSRKYVVDVMLKHLPSDTVVYYDTEYMGSLWNMERILKDSTSGVLMLQDDLVLANWFMEEVEKSILEDSVMTYFLGMSTKVKDWYNAGFSYVRMRKVWGQATYFPPSFISQYIEWASNQPPIAKKGESAEVFHRKFSADDTSIQECLRVYSRYAYLTLPNLVNHQSDIPSELGHPRTVKGIQRMSTIYGKKFLRAWNKEAIVKYD